MDQLNLNYIREIYQLFQDKPKAKLIQLKRFRLKKIKHLINQMLKDLLTSIKKNYLDNNLLIIINYFCVTDRSRKTF